MNNSYFSQMQGVNSILGNVLKTLGVDRGLRQITLVGYWPQLIGSRYEKKSKAVSVIRKNNQDILVVAVSSSVVSQELYMFKNDILSKIKPIAASLDFKIEDIIFNAKLWGETKKKDQPPQDEKIIEFYSKFPTDEELAKIEIPENIQKSVVDSAYSVHFESEDLRQRMINTALKNIKLQIWKKNQGFPMCERCGITLNYRKLEGVNLCPSCEYN